MSSISGVGGSGQVPQKPPEHLETIVNQIDAINFFNDITEQLVSLASEARLGGKGHD